MKSKLGFTSVLAFDIDSLRLLHLQLVDTERQKSMCGVLLCFSVRLSGNIKLRENECWPDTGSALGDSSLRSCLTFNLFSTHFNFP